MRRLWIPGNRAELLENGEAYFPRVFEAIARARVQVVIETFILFDDKVGRALQQVLVDAAHRGVSVTLTVDGWGSPPDSLGEEFIQTLTEAGIRFLLYGAPSGVLGMRLESLRRSQFVRRIRPFRRMHRKIVVVDSDVAFVGGLNFSADHLADYGPQAKQDYAVELRGPIVDVIRRFAERAVAPAGIRHRWRQWRTPVHHTSSPHAGTAQAMFEVRDNGRHTTDIERHYRVAIRSARREVWVANAYFFPGWRLVRELRRAARRGVAVRLILQGRADMAIVPMAARLLYGWLINDGVRIFEDLRKPLHGKVAAIDDTWATVGSSNLDPLSLSLNLEANVMLRDRAFNRDMRDRLAHLIESDCVEVDPSALPPDTWWRSVVGVAVFHFLRHFPSWVQWLPQDHPSLTLPPPSRRAAATRAGNDE